MKDFNPEPWVRSLLWLALTIAVVIAVVFDKTPVKIGGAGVQVEIGKPAEPERAAGPTAVTQSGAPSVRRGPGSVFASACPPRTRAIGGSCVVKSGTGWLQNFGPERDANGTWQFVCVWAWTSNAGVDGWAQAVCLPDPA
jgi:hypothetical protein